MIRQLLESKKANIGVVGVGFAEAGFSVTGFKVQADLVKKLNAGI